MSASPDLAAIRHRLAGFPALLRAVASGVSVVDARWKPAPEHWSILEACRHLLDEEREDFRPRLTLVLRDPQAEWPALDLKDVAQRRSYNDRDLLATIEQFASERGSSVEWLASLPTAVDWSVAKVHPRMGPMSAGMLLASWAAHDALHLRQIARRLHEMAARDAAGAGVGYAGEW